MEPRLYCPKCFSENGVTVIYPLVDKGVERVLAIAVNFPQLVIAVH